MARCRHAWPVGWCVQHWEGGPPAQTGCRCVKRFKSHPLLSCLFLKLRFNGFHDGCGGFEDRSDLNFCLLLFLDSSAVNEATFTWSGQLPPRNNKDPLYSCKVFLGGVPWDITEGNCCFNFSQWFYRRLLVFILMCNEWATIKMLCLNPYFHNSGQEMIRWGLIHPPPGH